LTCQKAKKKPSASQFSIQIFAMMQRPHPRHYDILRWPNFHGQKNLLNLEINYGSEKAKREPTQV
jgi:hypothetical protein